MRGPFYRQQQAQLQCFPESLRKRRDTTSVSFLFILFFIINNFCVADLPEEAGGRSDDDNDDTSTKYDPDVKVEQVSSESFARGLWAGELKRIYSRLAFVDPLVSDAFAEGLECLEQFSNQ